MITNILRVTARDPPSKETMKKVKRCYPQLPALQVVGVLEEQRHMATVSISMGCQVHTRDSYKIRPAGLRNYAGPSKKPQLVMCLDKNSTSAWRHESMLPGTVGHLAGYNVQSTDAQAQTIAVIMH